MTTLLSTPEITIVESITERCDSCSAAARLEATLTSGGTLAFCGHHANKHGGKLARITDRVTLEEGFAWTGKPAS